MILDFDEDEVMVILMALEIATNVENDSDAVENFSKLEYQIKSSLEYTNSED